MTQIKKRFRKFFFKGLELENMINLDSTELIKIFSSRARRKFQRGLQYKPITLIRKLRHSKKNCPDFEKPIPVRTHLRNMIIVPEMIGGVIAVYNGKTFNRIELKPEMIGHYLGEFSITYKPVKHGKPGVGASNSSKFVPLK